MATLEQLAEGIKRAQAAGDESSVRKLGAAYRQMQSAAASQPDPGLTDWGDQISAGFTSAVRSIPGIGEPLMNTLEGWKAAYHGATPEQIAAEDAAVRQANPNAVGIGEYPRNLVTEVAKDPLGTLNNFGTNLAASVPVAGPTLQRWGENVDAWADNNIYRPLTGAPGQTSPEEAGAAQAKYAQDHPNSSIAGQIAGPALSYYALSRLPGGNRALGFTGPWWQRGLFGFGSAEVINTADKVARGESLPQAAQESLGPSLLAAPLSVVFGHNAASASPRTRAAARTLNREGVDLTAGQELGSTKLRYSESQMGGLQAQNFAERQGEQFTQAALRRAGVNSRTADPDTMDAAFTNIGREFEGLAARNPLPADAQLSTDMANAVRGYNAITGQSGRAPIVENVLQDIVDGFRTNGNQISGEAYKAMRSRLGRAIKGTSSPELKAALVEITEALDGAVERGMAARGSQDLGAWRDVRNRYRNMLVIREAVTGSGESAVNGIITPAKLRMAAQTIYGKHGYVRGRGDLNELSRAGVTAMTPLPQSGTAPRIASMLPGGLGGGLGLSIGAQTGNATLGTAAALAGMATPKLLASLLLSNAGRAHMTGRSITSSPVFNAGLRAGTTPLLASLLAGGG